MRLVECLWLGHSLTYTIRPWQTKIGKHWAEPKLGLTEASGMAADCHPRPGTLELTTPLQVAVSLLLGGSWFEVGAGSGYRK